MSGVQVRHCRQRPYKRALAAFFMSLAASANGWGPPCGLASTWRRYPRYPRGNATSKLRGNAATDATKLRGFVDTAITEYYEEVVPGHRPRGV